MTIRFEDIKFGLKKKEIRALIKSASEIRMFIHADYVPGDSILPRVNISKQYATRLIAFVENDKVPGVVGAVEDASIITLYPYSWIDLESEPASMSEFPEREKNE